MPSTWLFDISAVLALAAAVGFVVHRFRIPLIVAYLAAGLVIGYFFPDVPLREPIFGLLAQIGVVAMLFIIGMQLDLRRLRELGGTMLLIGLAQMAVTTLFGLILTALLRLSWTTSLFIAYCLSMGSTLVVTKVLSEKRDLGKFYGRISLGILLLQDFFAAIALIIIASHKQEASTLPASALEWIGWGMLTVGAIWIARRVAIKILPFIARSQELLLLFAIAWGMMFAAWFTRFGASAELGSLIAGILLASTPWRFEVAAKLRPLRDLFLVFFFLLLGATVNVTSLTTSIFPLLALIAFVLLAKPLIVFVLLIGSSYAKRAAFLASLTQGHVSEFSLLLVALASKNGFVSPAVGSILTAAGLISIAVSSVIIARGSDLFEMISPALNLFTSRRNGEHAESSERYDVMLFGCHRVGVDLLRSIAASGRSCLVVDYDPQRINELTDRRIACRYGDAEDPEFLDELPWKRARMLLTSIPDPDVNALLLKEAEQKNPSCLRLVVAHHAKEAVAYYDAGASYVIVPHDLGGMHATSLLDKHGFRRSGFAREKAAHLEALRDRLESERAFPAPLPSTEPEVYT